MSLATDLPHNTTVIFDLSYISQVSTSYRLLISYLKLTYSKQTGRVNLLFSPLIK